MKKRIQMIGGLLLGVAIGTAVGILIAPSSGKKTRDTISKKSRKLGREFNTMVSDSVGKVKEGYNRKVDEYADAGVKSFNTLKEKIKV